VELGKFKKILSHPKKDEIIKDLSSGVSPERINEKLRVQYKDNLSKIIGITLLREFRELYLQDEEVLKKAIKESSNDPNYDPEIAASLLKNEAWQLRLKKVADQEIDLKQKISNLISLAEARTEQVFDQIQLRPQSFKGDYVLIKWFETMFMGLEKLDKVVNGSGDTLIQNNINIQMVEEHSNALQGAVLDTLNEFDPAIAADFLEHLRYYYR